MLSVSEASRPFCHAERGEASQRFFASLRMTARRNLFAHIRIIMLYKTLDYQQRSHR